MKRFFYSVMVAAMLTTATVCVYAEDETVSGSAVESTETADQTAKSCKKHSDNATGERKARKRPALNEDGTVKERKVLNEDGTVKERKAKPEGATDATDKTFNKKSRPNRKPSRKPAKNAEATTETTTQEVTEA